MKKYIHISLAVIAIVLLTCSCSNRIDRQGKPVRMRYASFLKLQAADGFICADIVNPWDTTQTMHRYIIVPKNKKIPVHIPDGTIIRTPLRHTIVFSSVHCALLAEWGKIDAIAGVCDLKYVIMPALHQRAKEGKLIDLGNSMQPDAEKMVSMHPDAILLSPYKDNDDYGFLGKSGIPLIECADYMETSPLGRAEWMKFYGLLFGCEDKADSLFESIEREYTDMKKQTDKTKFRPTVFADMKDGEGWMVPGGKSTIGLFIQDAGAKYLFDDKKQSGSITVSAEDVVNRCQHADFWLIKYNNGTRIDYKSLSAQDPLYNQFDAVKKHHVYGCNTGIVPFYEEAPFHPERLLKDLIAIFHPELIKNYKPTYYKSL